MKHCNNKLLIMMMCACAVLLFIAVLGPIRLRDNSREESLANDRSGLYIIMALQYFSFRYGLPSEFSVTYNETNNLININIYTKEKSIGTASVKSTFSYVNPDLVFSNCIREDHPIPCEIVSLALLWGCKIQGSSLLKNGFDINVKESSDEFFIMVVSHLFEMSGEYMVSIDKKSNRITGSSGR